MLVTKPDDLYWAHWKKIKTVGGLNPREHAKYRLFPNYEDQWGQFAGALMQVWHEGAWCVYVDETYYVEKELGLGPSVIKLLTQGRSKGISVVCGVQRPAWVSRFVLSEPTHVICFRLGDKRDLKALKEGVSDDLAAMVPELGKFEFAYYSKETGELSRGRAENLEEMMR